MTFFSYGSTMVTEECFMIIYFDSYCSLCRNIVAAWKKVDWLDKLTFTSFRSLGNYPQAMEQQLHVYHHYQWYQGYSAILEIAKMLPLMWVFLPVLYLFKWLGTGNFIYRKFAANRKLIPLNKCSDEKCSLTSRR